MMSCSGYLLGDYLRNSIKNRMIGQNSLIHVNLSDLISLDIIALDTILFSLSPNYSLTCLTFTLFIPNIRGVRLRNKLNSVNDHSMTAY